MQPRLRKRGEIPYHINETISSYFPNNNCDVPKQGDLAQALADLNQSIALAPDMATLYLNRAEVYLRQGNNIRAFQNLRKALVLGLEEPEEAKRVQKQAEELQPEYYALLDSIAQDAQQAKREQSDPILREYSEIFEFLGRV